MIKYKSAEDLFKKKIQASKEFSKIFQDNKKRKEFLSLAEKSGMTNFVEVSTFSNFHDVYRFLQSIYEFEEKTVKLAEVNIKNMDLMSNTLTKIVDILPRIVGIDAKLKDKVIILAKQHRELDREHKKYSVVYEQLIKNAQKKLKGKKESSKEREPQGNFYG